MNVKKLFWRFWIGSPAWARNEWFAIHWQEECIGGVLYAGITVFRVSFLYSEAW